MEKLTTTEKYLVDFLHEHHKDVAHWSIVKLSEEANVSTASIVRTMKKLGYEGFTAYKHYLKQEKQLSSQSHKQLEQIDHDIKQVILKNELEVQETINQLNSQLLEDAIQYISSAKQVYLFARGLSELIASEMEMKFHLLERTCEQYTDPNIIKTISKRITDKDLVIYISLNGETAELVESMKICREREVPTLLLTANPQGTLALLADIKFLGFKSMGSYFPEYEVRSRLPLQVIARILLDAYAIRIREEKE